MIRIGSLEVHLILESTVRVDAGGAFGLVPRALWGKLMPYDDNNTVVMTQHVLFVQSAGRRIVIDTGLGGNLTSRQIAFRKLERPRGTLIDALNRLGIRPEDIDLVIDTHLHNDHCGGNVRVDADGRVEPVFPNAEYVVQRREYEDALHPNERTRATYILDNYQPLYERGQLRLLDGDTELAPGIRGVVAPGHTPGHMAVRLEDGGEHGAFVCDMASYAIHFERLGWMTAYDVEPLITLETKRAWQHWALETHALLFFPHDPLRPAGRLILGEGGAPVVTPVTVDYV
jgi:glyoxylase-like metal-dependent hydrolase (beta-lactamase superfamily II)